MSAPVVIFAYNRPDNLQRLLTLLQSNHLSSQSDIYLFIDGPKSDVDSELVNETKEVAKIYGSFRNKYIFESSKNKGLAQSIIDGVNQICLKHDKFIVLEDDLILSPHFLNFMNQSINFYENNPDVFSISGWSINVKNPIKNDSDILFHLRHSSWGWGMTRMQWNSIVFDKNELRKELRDNQKLLRKFSIIGSDLPKMLMNCLDNKNDSWAVRACWAQFKLNKFTVCPSETLVLNDGFSDNATHTTLKNWYDQAKMSDKNEWAFRSKPHIRNSDYIKNFTRFFSVKNRLVRKLMERVLL